MAYSIPESATHIRECIELVAQADEVGRPLKFTLEYEPTDQAGDPIQSTIADMDAALGTLTDDEKETMADGDQDEIAEIASRSQAMTDAGTLLNCFFEELCG